MLTVIRSGVTRVARFGGRDGLGAFWPYAASVVGLTFALTSAIFVPIVNRVFDTGEPPNLALLVRSMAVVFALAVVLLAAAVARRLHDRGWSGLWGLMPLPFITVSLVGMGRLFQAFVDGSEIDPRLFLTVFLSNMLYIASLGLLGLLLAGSGTPGPNRYGPGPKAA